MGSITGHKIDYNGAGAMRGQLHIPSKTEPKYPPPPPRFLINMNDISRCSKKLSFILFADDTNLFHSHKNVDILYNTMNQELINVTSWLSCNKLSLNVKKTHFMLFKTERKKIDQVFEIKINDKLIDMVNYPKWFIYR